MKPEVIKSVHPSHSEPCKRPKCKTPEAIADHALVFDEKWHVAVCAGCAAEARLEGFEVHHV